MAESTIVAAACGTEVKARGKKSHERACAQCKQVSGAAEPSVVANMQGNASSDEAAAAIGAALGGATGTTFAPPTDTVTPAGIFKSSVVPQDGDRPPNTPREDLDPLTIALGATMFRAGTENRFDWCREGRTVGPRHTFSRMYPEIRVLVDVYASRNKAVEKEVAFKAAIIAERNEQVSRDEQWGYLPVIRDERAATQDEIDIALGRGCVTLGPSRRELIARGQSLAGAR